MNLINKRMIILIFSLMMILAFINTRPSKNVKTENEDIINMYKNIKLKKDINSITNIPENTEIEYMTDYCKRYYFSNGFINLYYLGNKKIFCKEMILYNSPKEYIHPEKVKNIKKGDKLDKVKEILGDTYEMYKLWEPNENKIYIGYAWHTYNNTIVSISFDEDTVENIRRINY